MSHPFLAEIGQVAAQFALLELQLELTVGSLLFGGRLETQALGRIVTAELSFRKQVDLMSALWRYRNPSADDRKLRKVAASLLAAERERNTIIHSSWFLAEEDQVLRVKTTAKGKLMTKSEKVKPSDIRAIAEKIGEAGSQLMEFCFPSSGPGPRLSDVL